MAGSDCLVELAIEPAPRAWDSVAAALDLARGQLGLQVRANAAAGQIVLGARTEERLRSALLYLQAAVPDGYRAGAVQVAYRETPAQPAEATYTHKKQSGGSGEFAEVFLRLVPGERGAGVLFFNEEVRGNIPAQWVPSVEKGIRQAAVSDPLGPPLTDFAVHLLDGKYHDLNSSPMAFERAGAGAMRHALQAAGGKLLEPIAKVVVLTPQLWVAKVVAELERRNAKIEEVRPGAISQVLCLARMVEMLGFEDGLRAASDGTATAAMMLHSYVEAPDGDGPDESYPISAALRA